MAAALVAHAADDVQHLPNVEFDAQFVPDGPGLATGVGHQHVAVHERQIADKNGDPLTKPAGLAGPAVVAMVLGEHRVRGRVAAAAGRVVHHVVVKEREGVHQLEGGTRIGHQRIGRVATGGDVTPVAKCGPQPLATNQDQSADLCHRLGKVRVERRPSGVLGLQEFT